MRVNQFSYLKRNSIDVFHNYTNPTSVDHLYPHHIVSDELLFTP